MYASTFILPILITVLSSAALVLSAAVTATTTITATTILTSTTTITPTTTVTPALRVRVDHSDKGALRGPMGSIAGFHAADCSGEAVKGATAADGTPVLAEAIYDGTKDTCITFNTAAENIRVLFGSFHSMRAYNNPHCIAGDDQKGMLHYVSLDEDRQTCVDQKQAFGGMIASVNFYSTNDTSPASDHPVDEIVFGQAQGKR